MTAGTFHLVVDRTPTPIRHLLARACEGLDVPYREVHLRAVDPLGPPLPRGAMLFNPASSAEAEAVERHLFAPGVATLYADDLLGPYQLVQDQLGAFTRAGLPVPRSVRVRRVDRELVDRLVDQLGLPLVVKVSGGENGAGVLRVDTPLALLSTLQALTLAGAAPLVQAYVDGATHWRLIVVGDRVVSAYRNVPRPGDFRTGPSDDPADFGLVPDPAWAKVALQAAAVTGVAFAGVDLLVQDDGHAWLLEANSPCWFPAAQEHPGTPDVAAAMVAWLRAKAERLAG